MSAILTPNTVMPFTAMPRKAALFAEDSFFRQGLAEARHRLGPQFERAMARTGLMLFKPDAIAGRKTHQALEIIAHAGFTPMAWAEGAFTGPVIHSLWRYQMHRNTLDKIRLYTRFSLRVPYLVVAFRDEQDESGGAARLSDLKGPAVVEARRPDQIRSRLGSPNPILNFIHSSDEPADVLREMPVLITGEARNAFLVALGAIHPPAEIWVDLRRCLARIEAGTPRCDVDPIAAGARIAAGIAKCPGPEARALSHWLNEVRAGAREFDLMAFEDRCAAIGARPDDLDMFVFGSAVVARNIKGVLDKIEVRA